MEAKKACKKTPICAVSATRNCMRRKFPAPRQQAGFSLLELSIVLVITGIILSGLVSGVDAQLEQRDRRQTRQQLEEIKQALLGFAVAKGRLPCPDVSAPPNGEEDPCAGAGAIATGVLPYSTLGTGQFDAWQRNFAYGVTVGFADTTIDTPLPPGASCIPPFGRSAPPPPGVSFELCAQGSFDICTVSVPPVCPTFVAQAIPAVVISHGRNGGLAPTTPDELENQDGDDVAVDKAYSSNPAQPFDDLVEFISANELMYIMLAGGVFR
ncbi:MAG: type II secretion system protein [Gammaproteobacteria bacterium]